MHVWVINVDVQVAEEGIGCAAAPFSALSLKQHLSLTLELGC